MSRTPLNRLIGRSALVVGGLAVLVVLPALPALASAPPTTPSGLSVVVSDGVADLSWNDGDGTGAIVRDVTGVAAPFDPASSGRLVTSTATSAHDTGFVNAAQTTYAVWSTSGDSTPSAAPLVQAVLLPTALTLQISNPQLGFGTPLNVAGLLTRLAGAAAVPAANAPVDLVGLDGGSSAPRVVRHLMTDGNGKVFASLKPYRSLALTLRFTGDAFSGASTSPTRAFTLVPKLTGVVSPTTIVLHEQSAITGHVSPLYANVRVLLQTFSPGGWHSLAETRTTGTGAYRFVVAPAVGIHPYRALLTGTAAWVQAASPTVTLRVDARDLASGLVGSDVLALKRSLAALHFNPGALTTSFGPDLTHAVIAFQKVERLPRTGRWTKVERARIAHPTLWTLRYGSSGRAVEIDITRQVLVYSVNHVVTLIADLSSGGEYHYTYQGVTYLAHTPRGRFSIQHKIDGIRISHLGYLYRPSYFQGGNAIHGEGFDVPSRPASHGCVRVTNTNADLLFPLLTRGVPVDVYDE